MRRFTTPPATGSSSSTSAAAARSRPTPSRREHDLGSRRRYGADTRAPRHRALAGIRRILGFNALALAYAETHPERVTELVLRGIFLLRKQEIDWFYQEAPSISSPTPGSIPRADPRAERGDMVAAYHRRLTSDDRDMRS